MTILDPVKDRIKLADRYAYYTGGLVEVEIEHEFSDEEGPVALLVKSWFRPGSEAPSCSDPDSPLFGETGDPDEFLIESVHMKSPPCLVSEEAWKDDTNFEEAVLDALREDYKEALRDARDARGS